MLRYRFHFAIQNSYEVLKDPQNFNTLPAFRFHVNIHPCAHATRGACYNRGRLETISSKTHTSWVLFIKCEVDYIFLII